jgi:predicted Zn-dependent protease
MSIKLPPGTAAHSEQNPPPEGHHLVTLLALLVGLFIAVWVTISFLFNQVINWIPPSVERQLGAIAIAAFEQQAEPSDTQDTLNQLLDRLEAKLPEKLRRDRDYQLLYIPDDTVNALALPGDHVIVYRGLLAQADSENEIMMVLGHELGHFANRDHLRGLGRGILVQVVASMIFGNAGSINAAGLETFARSQFSQQQEIQADEFGLTLIQQIYGHAGGATAFFARIGDQPGANFDFLTTHPAPLKRVRRLEKLIQDRGYNVQSLTPLPPSLKVGS